MKTTRIHLIRVKLGLVVVLVAVALNSTGNFQPTRAASSSGATAATQDISVSDSSTAHGEKEDVIGTLADGYIAIVNSTFLTDQAVEWNPRHLEIAKQVFEDAVMNSDHGYVSRRKGFGSLSLWAQPMGITPAPEECRTGCQFAGGAIRLAYNPALNTDTTTWVGTAPDRFPVITVGSVDDPMISAEFAYHELAHIWDGANGWGLGTTLDQAMEVERDTDGNVVFDLAFEATRVRHGNFATDYFNPVQPALPHGIEHFADTVLAYFLFDVPDYSWLFHVCWADEDPRCEAKFEYDRYDFVRDLVLRTYTH